MSQPSRNLISMLSDYRFQGDWKITQYLYNRFCEGHQALSNFGSLITGSQYNKLYQLCKKYLTPKAKILDWGAGNGHASYYLWKRGYQVSGFTMEHKCHDLLSEEADYAQIMGNHSEPVCLPYANDCFDAVVSVGVLEHVKEIGGDELESLNEIKRILKPDGIFICCHLPNRFSWIELVATYLGNSLYHHQYKYTRKEIVAFCENAQLDLQDCARYGILPRTLVTRFLPAVLKSSVFVAVLFNAVDQILAILCPLIAQNYYFICKKSA